MIVKRVVAVVVAICAVLVFVDGFTHQNWITVGLSVAAVVLLIDWIRPSPSTPTPVDPATVPPEDVVEAIDTTDSRIPAIKLLRERHPGLGLKEAKDLVDHQLGRQS